jgi:cell wall-associated NlpC family hydrolase
VIRDDDETQIIPRRQPKHRAEDPPVSRRRLFSTIFSAAALSGVAAIVTRSVPGDASADDLSAGLLIDRQEAVRASRDTVRVSLTDDRAEAQAASDKPLAAPSPAKTSTPKPRATSSPRAAQPAPKGGTTRQRLLVVARSLFGIPYVWGGESLSGMDCSGYTQYVYGKLGLSLPRVSWDQFDYCNQVRSPAPGDLVFIGAGQPHHVGIYSRPGYMFNAKKRGTRIGEDAIWHTEPVRYGRHPKL